MGLTCCQSMVVGLSVVDLVLGSFFLFAGLWILLDWEITELWVWLPFVVIGGLLIFTTFLSFCGACANKCCSCCLKVSSPLVLVICVLECAMGLAILFAWTYVEDHYLKPFDKKIDPNQNGTGSGDGNDLIAEEAAGYSVGEEAHHIDPHNAKEVEGKVKADHKIIAYVLFVLSFLQLVRLLAGWCVNRGKRSHHARGNAQTWLYDDDGDKYRSIEETAQVHDDLRAKYADRAARSSEARGRLSDQQESLLPGAAGSRTTASKFQRNTQTQIIDLTPSKCAIM